MRHPGANKSLSSAGVAHEPVGRDACGKGMCFLIAGTLSLVGSGRSISISHGSPSDSPGSKASPRASLLSNSSSPISECSWYVLGVYHITGINHIYIYTYTIHIYIYIYLFIFI